MPIIESVELSVSGRRRRAVLTVVGTVAFDQPGDDARNGAYLRIRLHAVDSGIRDGEDLGDVLGVCDAWFVRGQMERYEPTMSWSGRHNGSHNWLGGQINATRAERARFRFQWDNRRSADDGVFKRPFNEDRPGRDEVVSVALCLPSLPDGRPSPGSGSPQRISNIVSGRF